MQKRNLVTSSTVLSRRAILSCWLAIVSSAGLAKDAPPRIVQEPVLGLRFEIAKQKFESLAADVLARCNAMDNERERGHYWVFAFAKDAARAYYVIGGYGERTNVAPRVLQRYVSYDFGAVIYVEGKQCVDLGSAREVFDAGEFGDDMPEPILKQLAADLAVRLSRGLGGTNNLRAELRNQHVDLDRLPVELHDALKPYFEP